ncbi:MAG: 3'(2'),5'-bisphosphate nucleotidase [Armatimonadota bacterium]
MTYHAERQAAIEAVRQAALYCRAVQETFQVEDTLTKRDRSPVTVADYGAQALVLRRLRAAFPDDGIVAEEDCADLQSEENTALRERLLGLVSRFLPGVSEAEVVAAIGSGSSEGGAEGRFWVLDPVDGTKGFLRKEQYAIALGLLQDGQVVLGVLGCPNLPFRGEDGTESSGCLFVAVRGEGVTVYALEGDAQRRAEVAEVGSVTAAVLCESVESGHSSHGDAERVRELLGITAPSLRMDSQAKYGAVARGDASIYLRLSPSAEYREKIWDHAAGAIVVQEAGGTVTDAEGNPLDFSRGRRLEKNRGILAAPPSIHAQVLAAVREVTGRG